MFDYERLHYTQIYSVGRTGRAGQKGEAYTFVTPDQDKYAVDIIKALTLSNVEVPPELDEMANQFMEKIKSGTANYSSSGFGGKGLEKLDKERDILKKIQKRSHGLGDAEEEEDEEATREKIEKTFDDNVQAGAPEAIETPIPEPVNPTIKAASLAGLAKAQQLAASFKPNVPVAAPTTARSTARPATGPPVAPFSFEIEINDYPQKARWKVTNKEQISQISEMSGAAITTRGSVRSYHILILSVLTKRRSSTPQEPLSPQEKENYTW